MCSLPLCFSSLYHSTFLIVKSKKEKGNSPLLICYSSLTTIFSVAAYINDATSPNLENNSTFEVQYTVEVGEQLTVPMNISPELVHWYISKSRVSVMVYERKIFSPVIDLIFTQIKMVMFQAIQIDQNIFFVTIYFDVAARGYLGVRGYFSKEGRRENILLLRYCGLFSELP